MGVDLTVYSVHYYNLYTMCTTRIGSCKKSQGRSDERGEIVKTVFISFLLAV